MAPINPVAAAVNTRWNTRLHPYLDIYFDRRPPIVQRVAPDQPATLPEKERVLTVPDDPSRGRTVDLQV